MRVDVCVEVDGVGSLHDGLARHQGHAAAPHAGGVGAGVREIQTVPRIQTVSVPTQPARASRTLAVLVVTRIDDLSINYNYNYSLLLLHLV